VTTVGKLFAHTCLDADSLCLLYRTSLKRPPLRLYTRSRPVDAANGQDLGRQDVVVRRRGRSQDLAAAQQLRINNVPAGRSSADRPGRQAGGRAADGPRREAAAAAAGESTRAPAPHDGRPYRFSPPDARAVM